MPGLSSIHAALHPTPGDSLYFVANVDGSHRFTATLEAHNKAVIEYRSKLKNENTHDSKKP